MRLDYSVARQFGLSRRAAREAVRAGRVDVDGATRDEPGYEVSDTAVLKFLPSRPARHRVRTRLVVLLEDEAFLIVDKPAGLLAVPTAQRERDTLLARTLDYLHHRYRRRPYAGVVHRLDKDTSGALVFARTRVALKHLQEQFRSHTIGREYLAIVEGATPAAGTLDTDLVRDGGQRRRAVARPGQPGRRAVTHYRALEGLAGATLVSVQLETGRTHQIRVHFAAAGHPVLGDQVYRSPTLPPPAQEVPRQMLHAATLGFAHPILGTPVRVTAPLPEDFRAALQGLRRRVRKQSSESPVIGPRFTVRSKKKAPRSSGLSRGSRKT